MKTAVWLALITGFLFSSCKKEEKLKLEDISGLGGDTWVKGPIDNWIYDSLTKPYNIGVKYKWDQFELELGKTLVPPKEEKVIPLLRTIKKVWIDSYVAEAGDLFIKKFAPKYFILNGSMSLNADGTETLGTAEGGRKIVLYRVNDFRVKGDPGFKLSDSSTIKLYYFHVIQHEFAHILHQTIMYPPEFKQISPALYTATWFNYSDAAAFNNGFITPYSMAAFDEDFVEMVSTLLTEGQAYFDNVVNSINYTGTTAEGITAAQARSNLRQKEALVKNYFSQVWKINFTSLQTRTRAAFESFIY